jgi:hypothetical protein
MLRTVYGWGVTLQSDINPRSVRNFPMQATAAEILRVACILLHYNGVRLCAPVHDAILLEAEDASIEDHAALAQRCMVQASKVVLDGFELSSDIQILSYPQRFLKKDDEPFWSQVIFLLEKAEAQIVEDLTPTC